MHLQICTDTGDLRELEHLIFLLSSSPGMKLVSSSIEWVDGLNQRCLLYCLLPLNKRHSNAVVSGELPTLVVIQRLKDELIFEHVDSRVRDSGTWDQIRMRLEDDFFFGNR